MDDVVMTFEQLVECAKSHRTKNAGLGTQIGRGIDAFGRMWGRGVVGIGQRAGQGVKTIGRFIGTNPGKATAGVAGIAGLGALGPGGMGARALGSMGIIDDPVKQYGSNTNTYNKMRTNFYDNEYLPEQQRYQQALAAGTATAEDYQRVQDLATKYQTGEYGGGWFGQNANYYRQAALDAGRRMKQPYKPTLLKRLFGGYADQAGYNQYAQNQLRGYGVQAPPGFGSSTREGVGPLLPNAPLLHRDTGQLYTQAPTPLDPTQLALQNLYSGRNQLPSAWH